MDTNQNNTAEGQVAGHDQDISKSGIIETVDFVNEKFLAVISYFGFFMISLFPKHDTKFTRYHANQGLVLAIMTLAFELVLQLIRFPFTAFNAFDALHIVNIVLAIVGTLAPAFFIIIGALNAYNGSCKPLPLFGKIRIIS